MSEHIVLLKELIIHGVLNIITFSMLVFFCCSQSGQLTNLTKKNVLIFTSNSIKSKFRETKMSLVVKSFLEG